MEKFTHNPVKYPILRTKGLATPEGAKFGMTRNNGTRAHQGIDLALDKGMRCYAVENGKVVSTALALSGYGMTVCIQLNCPTKTLLHNNFAFYAHMSKINVKVGQEVKAGDIIGLSGDSGNAKNMTTVEKGGHLHFEIRTKRNVGMGLDGRIDPLPFVVF